MKNIVLLAMFTAVWIGLATLNRRSRLFLARPFGEELRGVPVWCAAGSLPGLVFALTSVSGTFGWAEVVVFWIAMMVAAVAVRVALRLLGNVLWPRLAPVRHCVILGSGARAVRMAVALRYSSRAQYRILGFVDDPGPHTTRFAGPRLLGGLRDLGEVLKVCVVDEVLIGLPARSCYGEIQAAIRACEQVGVPAEIPDGCFVRSMGRRAAEPGRWDGALLAKRTIDLAGASIGLILLAPLMAAIAILIRFTSRGPALFSQLRYGLNKRVFTIHKFRTMYDGAESRQQELEAHNEMSGPVFKIRDDPRVTPLGRLLRRTSLDELPQLWNVLNGTMSLVGPRPLPVRDVSRFSDAWLMRRFSVKPGITCLWQVSGRNRVGFERWIELDLEYIDTWSLELDFRILARTVGAVVRGEGAA